MTATERTMALLSGAIVRAECPWPGPSASRRYRLFAGNDHREGQQRA